MWHLDCRVCGCRSEQTFKDGQVSVTAHQDWFAWVLCSFSSPPSSDPFSPFPNSCTFPITVQIVSVRSSSCAWPSLLNAENASFLDGNLVTVFTHWCALSGQFFSLTLEEISFIKGKETVRERHVASLKVPGTLEPDRSWCNVLMGDWSCSSDLQVVETCHRLKVFLGKSRVCHFSSVFLHLHYLVPWLLWPSCSAGEVISLCLYVRDRA